MVNKYFDSIALNYDFMSVCFTSEEDYKKYHLNVSKVYLNGKEISWKEVPLDVYLYTRTFELNTGKYEVYYYTKAYMEEEFRDFLKELF